MDEGCRSLFHRIQIVKFVNKMTYSFKKSGLKYLISVALFLFLFLYNAYCQDVEKGHIRSAFDPATYSWNISWPGRVSQYDLLYLNPPVDALQGIPIGNGEVGVLFWCEDSRIIAAVNKSDLWDDASFGPFHNWSGSEEDYSTTLRHACRIIFDFKYPVFSTLYLKDFKGRLNISDGSMQIEALSVFGKVSLKAFVDHQTGLLLCDLVTDLAEDVPADISMERFGSRTFSHWYSQINSDATIGTEGTEAYADSNGSFITQKLSSGSFAAGVKLLSSNDLNIRYTRDHSRSSSINLSGGKKKDARIVFTVTSPLEKDPLKVVQAALEEAELKGPEYYSISNSQAWKSIWERSFMDYGDEYLNNLWYLTIFYANASQGGHYPGRFNNGMWCWDRDVQNWNFYFHWNQQQLFWPLNAAGLPELVEPYLRFRFESLPMAERDARSIFNADGAFISDVTERRGFNSGSENANHTPVAEIALDFWRQYKYTCDKKFLKEKALPFINDAARFIESLLQKEQDGLYHARKGTGYEGWIEMHDALTELVYARVLLRTAVDAFSEAGIKNSDTQRWNDILAHLAPLPVIKSDEKAIAGEGSRYTLRAGVNKGMNVKSDSIFSAGWGLKEKEWLTVYSPAADSANYGLKLLDGIFPSVPSSPVFPSGLIGLKDKGSSEYTNMLTTTLLYGREVTGWDPVPVVMARLGMKQELEKDLKNFPARWQIYCNGWGHWGVEGEANKDAGWFFRTNMVRDVAHPERGKFPFPMWPFRHMSMESMSVFATAINESLLQSYDGVIRVFPAFPDDRFGRFTLHAEGGFIVSSEKKGGEIVWISIKSLYGNNCKIELPWERATVVSALNRKKVTVTGKIVDLKTIKGDVITLTCEGLHQGKWEITGENPLPNEMIRDHPSGRTRIGIPRMF
jgi:alpha-L-fucosidase 2